MSIITEYISEYLNAINTLNELKKQKQRTDFGVVNILGWNLEFKSIDSLISGIDQILIRRLNDFNSTVNDPFIIDCGANIGLSVLAYKRRYPSARIIAFEPDPEFLPILKRNLQRNGASDVQVIEAASWISNGSTMWLMEGVDGSRIATPDGGQAKTTTVNTVDLNDYLDEPVDLLKVDIEGSEFKLIPHINSRLHNVKAISLECHLGSDPSRQLSDVLSVLSETGFKFSLNSFGEWRDLIRQPATPGLRSFGYLLVSCWRETIPCQSNEDSLWLASLGMDPLLEIQRLENSCDAEKKKYLKNLYSITSHFQNKETLEETFKFQNLRGPFASAGGFCFSVKLNNLSQYADSITNPERSELHLFEDGNPLIKNHSIHVDIQQKGHGRYSHWGKCLLFSSSDGADPNTNGRNYSILIVKK
jgi:FkbM family methyltransferase